MGMNLAATRVEVYLTGFRSVNESSPDARRLEGYNRAVMETILSPVNIGVLALQGDFDAHRKTLEQIPGVSVQTVRTLAELARVDGLVLPGGESTTIGKLLNRFELMEPLRQRIANGMPIYGTCAGLILLATHIQDRPDQPSIGALNATVARNAFGAQVDSFEADISMNEIDPAAKSIVRGVFIRAPYVVSVGDQVKVLAEYEGRIVAVRQAAILGTAFHPELTADNSVHELFVSMVRNSSEVR